ncbi:MAG: hypothetical protein IE925_09455 [Rhodobacterales bacterium]|nr:hypothetical protein [Rhodobacterales bacterium]
MFRTERSRSLAKSLLMGMAVPFGIVTIAAILGVVIAGAHGATSISELSRAAVIGAMLGGLLALWGGVEMIFGIGISGLFDRGRHWSDYVAMAAGYAVVWLPAMYVVTSRF